MSEQEIINELTIVHDRLGNVVDELKKSQGVISTEILNIIDDINRLSVEI